MNHEGSVRTLAKIARHIPGGVNTTQRKIDPPIVFTDAKGSRIRDIDGNEYIDYHAAFGPIILGHRDEDVERRVDEIRQRMDLVAVTGTEIEGQVCDKISQHMPSAEKVLLCNTGSEATYHAIRLARAITKRKRIIKFQGCYHGWHDYVSMSVASPPEKLGQYDPLSAGTLPEAMYQTLVLRYNSTQEVERCVAENRGQIAAVIIEPIAQNIGCVPASLEFLRSLREICDREEIVLIFDEVFTAFRHALGGYQSICKVIPDLTTFGKALANGYPIAGLGGRADLMGRFATAGGDVFFGGTFNAHPYCCAAALATLEKLEDGRIFERLFKFGKMVSEGIDSSAAELGIETYTAHFGSVFVTYFTHPPISNYDDVLRNNGEAFVRYRKGMVDRGVFMLPLNLKRNFMFAAHTKNDILETIAKSRDVFSTMKPARKATSENCS